MASAIARIRGRRTFRDLARPSGRATSGPVRVAFTAGGAPAAPRVGYAVSRRHGGAVRRNRLRRRLREAVSQAVRDAGGAVVPGAYLVRAEPEAVALPYAELVRRLGEAMRAACGPPPLARRARS